MFRGKVCGNLAVCGARGDAAAVWRGVRTCVGDEDSAVLAVVSEVVGHNGCGGGAL